MNALVLSGGGARGAFQAGVVAALLERESFDLICGTSIGALNGAAVAQNEPGLLREVWQRIGSARVLRLDRRLEAWRKFGSDVRKARILPALAGLGSLRIPNFSSMTGALDWEPIRTIAGEHFAFDRVARPFILGTTDVTRGTPATFFAFPNEPERARAFASNVADAHPITRENYVDAICASAAMPGAFPPVTIDVVARGPVDFVDGCVANNTPIRQAIDAGATRVTVIFLQHSALRSDDRRPRHVGHVVSACQDITDERMLDLDLKLARHINDAVERGAAPGKRFVDIRVIGPVVPLRLPALKFDDQAALDRVFRLGHEVGRAANEVARDA